MKRFRFSLQAVHTLRQRLEQVALEAYSQTLLRRQQVLARLQAIDFGLELAWAALRTWQTQDMAAAELRAAHEFCALLSEQKKETAGQLREAQQLVDVAWKKLVLARQRREGVEKYRQRQWAAYQVAAQREDQKLLDEVAQRRAAGINAGAWSLQPVLAEV